MRNWPQKMRHLLLDSAPAMGESWEALLQRFVEKVQQANTASALIDALTTPNTFNPLSQEPVQYQNGCIRMVISLVVSLITPDSTTLPNQNLSICPISTSIAPTLETAWMPLALLTLDLSPAVIVVVNTTLLLAFVMNLSLTRLAADIYGQWWRWVETWNMAGDTGTGPTNHFKKRRCCPDATAKITSAYIL